MVLSIGSFGSLFQSKSPKPIAPLNAPPTIGQSPYVANRGSFGFMVGSLLRRTDVEATSNIASEVDLEHG